MAMRSVITVFGTTGVVCAVVPGTGMRRYIYQMHNIIRGCVTRSLNEAVYVRLLVDYMYEYINCRGRFVLEVGIPGIIPSWYNVPLRDVGDVKSAG